MTESRETEREPALIRRDLSVRLVNVSASGCLLESDTRIAVGTEGTLRVVLEGRELTEKIVVVRCQPLQGAGGRCLVGGRFLMFDDGPGGALRNMFP